MASNKDSDNPIYYRGASFTISVNREWLMGHGFGKITDPEQIKEYEEEGWRVVKEEMERTLFKLWDRRLGGVYEGIRVEFDEWLDEPVTVQLEKERTCRIN